MIQTKQELLRAMRSIDHRGYPAYKSLRGSYDFGSYVLHIVHVQGDPFAAPSDLKVTVRADRAGWPAADCGRYENRVALQDMILRRFGRKLDDVSGRARGSGKSGRLSASRPGQEILDRSACQISAKGDVTLRFFAGFPAAGRTVLAGELEKMLFDYLPGCVESSAVFSAYPEEAVRRVTDLAEDQAFLREELKRRNLCAFVADGVVLPRESGISQSPLRDSVPFRSPDEDRVTIGLPHRGDVTGMGIRRGVTLIIGGGYHGKSTLLKALERGVYNHIAGDGRELVVTDESAVKVRAEDGRCVSRDDISLFINHLPNGKDTRDFSTENASGSTSQAAAVVEALECGAKTLLMDEDTCATNFMVRDERMQRIVSAEEEPITPFSGRMRALFTQAGVSTILVAGSSGAFFGEADTVIQMDRYEPKDVTVRVRELASAAGREKTVLRMPDARNRCPRPGRDFEEYKGRVKHKNLGKEGFVIGRGETDLRLVEQLVDGEQSECLAETFVLMAQSRMNGHNSVASLVGDWERSFEREGFGLYEKAGSSVSGNMAKPRKEELAAALNRCRGLLW
ncbi:ABC-ATPase domain-containing protein [Chordicoccus furentiruminis]|uniref:ABC-ATPase domain-containing protein n=1 Tax=Chordicoccus furentiruminis TaxID=2709410 RepID=UPI0023A8A458|nr:ABC-ATPase domain-containing protein [Chordicoccus furentiruminis]